jgi:hypothetical protein
VSTREKRDPGGTHHTPSGPVVWIPERSTSWLYGHHVVVAAAAGVALVGMVVWWPSDQTALAGITPSASTLTGTMLHSDTLIAVATRPAMTGAMLTVRAPRRPSYEDVTNAPDRLAALRSEIARCKDPSAACSVHEVLRMGSELVQIRKRANQ